jgi:predicted nucleic acid-binding protein
MGKLTVPAGARIYLDANILIHLVEGYPEKHGELELVLQRIEKADLRAVTSELSLAEVLVKPYVENNAQLIDLCEALLAAGPQLDVLPLTRQVLRRSAMVRAMSGTKLPDAVHIATALDARCGYFVSEDDRIRVPPTIALTRLADLAS